MTEEEKHETPKPLPLIAQQILDGRFGNGDKRIKRLTEAGYNPKEVQAIVDRLKIGGYKVMVTASSLRVRKTPTTDAPILDSLLNGTVVPVTEISEGKDASAWGRVSNGWISLDHVVEV